MTEGLQATASAESLVRQVGRFRRRLTWMAFARRSCVTCALAAVATVVAASVTGAQGRALWFQAAVAAISGLAAAAILTWLRVPTLRASGAAVDRQLGLADDVVAGLDLKESDEAIARLVVRGAVARLEGLPAAQVFPLVLGRWPGLAAVAIALSAVLLTAHSLRTTTGAGRDASTASRAGAPAGAGDGRDLKMSTASPAAVSAGNGSSGEAPRPSGESSGHRGEAADSTRRGESGGAARQVSGDDNQRPAASSSAARDATERAAVNGPSATGRGGNVTDPRVTGSGSRGSGGPGGAGDLPEASLTNAGGVRNGRLRASLQTQFERPAMAPRPTAAQRADARRRAENAVARDEVPPEYRVHVLQYFDSIGASERE